MDNNIYMAGIIQINEPDNPTEEIKRNILEKESINNLKISNLHNELNEMIALQENFKNKIKQLHDKNIYLKNLVEDIEKENYNLHQLHKETIYFYNILQKNYTNLYNFCLFNHSIPHEYGI